MIFQDSHFLYIFIFIALFFLWDMYKKFASGYALFFSSFHNKAKKIQLRAFALIFVRFSRYIVLSLLVLALAYPVKDQELRNVHISGVDIMLVLDISNSMSGEDFQPQNRLHAAKQVIKHFIKMRKSDRIGLVIFAGEAYLQSPLTLDYAIIHQLINEINFYTAREGGTAIGNALGLAASILSKSDSHSRLIILLTDGVNNRGVIDPLTVAEAAGKEKIKIYSVGIGKKGIVHGHIVQPDGRRSSFRFMDHYDEAMLRNLAEISGGKFFSAENTAELFSRLKEIDKLEKSVFEKMEDAEKIPLFPYFLRSAFLLFVIIILVERLYVQRFP